MEEFIPTTFRMDVREEREAFFAQQEGKMPQTSHLQSPLSHQYPDAAVTFSPTMKGKRKVCAWQS